jgi:hypothetical protein
MVRRRADLHVMDPEILVRRYVPAEHEPTGRRWSCMWGSHEVRRPSPLDSEPEESSDRAGFGS